MDLAQRLTKAVDGNRLHWQLKALVHRPSSTGNASRIIETRLVVDTTLRYVDSLVALRKQQCDKRLWRQSNWSR